MAINMKAPAGGQVIQARGGNTYTADANGLILNVTGADSTDLLHAGCTFATTTQTQSLTSGLHTGTPVNLFSARNTDGSALSAAASAGKFGASITLGTGAFLVSESANSNTKTDDAIFEYVMPSNYVAGTNFPVTVNASIAGSGTLSVKTAQIKAYRVASDGTMGADIGPGATQAMTAAGADVAFTVNGTTLKPGDKIILLLETVMTETAASAMTAHINSVRVG